MALPGVMLTKTCPYTSRCSNCSTWHLWSFVWFARPCVCQAGFDKKLHMHVLIYAEIGY